MEITEVRVKLITSVSDRLKAVCTVTFDEQFVVRDVKVVDGTNGLFVAMPSRKLSTHCAKCNHKNTIRSQFCNDCGAKLPPADPPEEENGRSRFHRDIAHPITTPFREVLQARVLEAYELECGAPPESTSTAAPAAPAAPVSQDGGEPEQGGGPDGGMTEYDAIIAGFRSDGRGSAGRSSRQPSPRETDGSRPQPEGRGRGQGAGRSNGRGGRSDAPARRRDQEKPPRDQPRKQSSESRPPRAEPVAQAREASVAKPDERAGAVVHSEPARDPVEGFGAGIMDNDPVPAKPVSPPKPVAAPPEPVSPPPAVVDDDGDNAFGAGIL